MTSLALELVTRKRTFLDPMGLPNHMYRMKKKKKKLHMDTK